MPIGFRSREDIHRRNYGVIAHDGLDGIEEDALAIAARPEQKQEGVFPDIARQTVAAPLLQKADKRRIAPRRFMKEFQPKRAIGCLCRTAKRRFRYMIR